MSRPSDEGRCDLCGEPMPEGESMFRMHGYSGPCPKPPLPVTTPTHCACVWHGQADGPPFSECHYHATLRAELAAAKARADHVETQATRICAVKNELARDLAAAKALLREARNCLNEADGAYSYRDLIAAIDAAIAGSLPQKPAQDA